MFCGNCGAKLDEGALFCGECGSKNDAINDVKQDAVKQDVVKQDVVKQDATKKSVNKQKNVVDNSIVNVNDKKKKHNIVLPIIIILIVLALAAASFAFIFNNKASSGNNYFSAGAIYNSKKQVITNKMVKVNNNYYYANAVGTPIVSTIKTIEGVVNYFDESGKQNNSDGWKNNIDIEGYSNFGAGYYYFKNGKIVKNEWVDNDYYVGDNGKMVVNQWVGEYYLGVDGKYLRNQYAPNGEWLGASGKKEQRQVYTPPATKAPAANVNNILGDNVHIEGANVIQNPDGSIQIGGEPQNGANVVQQAETEVVPKENQSSEELYILSTSKVSSTYSGDDDENCKITIVKPTFAGQNGDETIELSNCVSDLIDDMVVELEDLAGSYSETPKSITISKCDITTLTSSRVRITFTGKLVPRSGSQKNIKYRISYDRDSESAELEKMS